MNTLVTGCAGFIGFHFCKELLKTEKKSKIIGIDNFNDYYDVNLKKSRSRLLVNNYKENFVLKKIDILDKKKLHKIFLKYNIKKVVHLAAQAGVRYSIINPDSYILNNIVGFNNVMTLSIKFKVKQIIYASSSSVYGGIKEKKLNENLNINDPIQLYAATKISNEMIANAYYQLYKIPIVGLRFFTVYGPWGRPDMAPFKFITNIIKKKKIEVYNYGKNYRDFTFIDDIVKGVLIIHKKMISKNIKHEIFNIGNGNSVNVLKFIQEFEKQLNIKAKKVFVPMQKGDMVRTSANIDKLHKIFNYKPKITYQEGIKSFIDWYKNFY